jgi:hypothetical protein
MSRTYAAAISCAAALVAAASCMAFPAAAERSGPSCAQLNDRVFGSDGRGGIAARFRRLQAKIAEDTRAGQGPAAAKDRAEQSLLAESILRDAKTMDSNGCVPRVVPAATSALPPAPPLGPRSGPVFIKIRSAYGCVVFDGTWQTAKAVIRFHNGSGTYGPLVLNGTVSGNELRGTWYVPDSQPLTETTRSGTFVFALSREGETFSMIWTDANGRRTDAATASCVAP